MAESRRRTAVLISGRGSNLAALIAAAKDARYPAGISLVIADDAGAGGLSHAAEAGIPTLVVERRRFEKKAAFEASLDAALRDQSIEIVCLAGFMQVLSRKFVAHWQDRMLNIHPSLLPLFPGLDTHRRALEAGVRVHGATVHFVRPEVDSGPIIAQGAVPVLPGDTPEMLAARVLTVEHRIYPLALKLFAGGRARIAGNAVAIDGERPGPSNAALISPVD